MQDHRMVVSSGIEPDMIRRDSTGMERIEAPSPKPYKEESGLVAAMARITSRHIPDS